AEGVRDEGLVDRPVGAVELDDGALDPDGQVRAVSAPRADGLLRLRRARRQRARRGSRGRSRGRGGGGARSETRRARRGSLRAAGPESGGRAERGEDAQRSHDDPPKLTADSDSMAREPLTIPAPAGE